MFLKNENGNVTLALLGLLPLCLAVFLTVIAIFYVLRTHGVNLHECRTRLMRAESERLLVMQELMSLNPEARKLRAQEKYAMKAVRAARLTGNPQAIAAAEAAHGVVLALQLALSTKQKSLLLKANLEARISLSRLKSAIKTETNKDEQTYSSIGKSVIGDMSEEREVLAVEAKPSDSLTPDYEPAPNFEERERMRLTWKFWPARLLPDWLSYAEPYLRDFFIDGQCSSTAEKKGNNQWRSRLAADKPH
jgi:hypothetical protein